MAGAASAADLPMKIIVGADAFEASLKDAMVSHLRSLGIEVEDTGVTSYYSAGSEVGRRVSASTSSEIRGLVCCGTGVGVAMFANKFPGVYAATCLSVEDAVNARSISNCNVLALSGIKTSPESAVEIFDAWIKTPFKSHCPASGSEPWNTEISSFLDNSLRDGSDRKTNRRFNNQTDRSNNRLMRDLLLSEEQRVHSSGNHAWRIDEDRERDKTQSRKRRTGASPHIRP